MVALSMYLKPNFIYLCGYIWLATLAVVNAGFGTDIIKAGIQSKTQDPIEVAALGRPLSLGMLYDCRKDSFIPGVTLWDKKSLNENLHSRPQPRTDLKFSSSDSLSSSSIYLYEKGKLTDRQFQPTFKPPPTIAEPAIVGGTGGDEFSFKSALYNAFHKITITYNQNEFFTWIGVTSLNTIQVIFQDHQMIKVGRVAGNKEKVFLFDITDKIVSAKLWPNGEGNRFGGLEFVVEKNNGVRITMSIKCAAVGEPVIVNVGSGKSYGIKGRSGDEIDALAFYFS